MKEIQGQITLLVGRESTTLEIRDAKATITFVRAELTSDQLASALSQLGYTPMKKCTVFGLDKVGLKYEQQPLEFVLPSDIKQYGEEAKEAARRMAPVACPPGWAPQLYFDFQGSFTVNADGHTVAHTIAMRWVPIEEEEEDQGGADAESGS